MPPARKVYSGGVIRAPCIIVLWHVRYVSYRSRLNDRHAQHGDNNKSAQSNLGTGPLRCESVPRGDLITTAKVVAGEFITPHQLLPTLWAKPAHIAKAKARRSLVLKIDIVASVAA